MTKKESEICNLRRLYNIKTRGGQIKKNWFKGVALLFMHQL